MELFRRRELIGRNSAYRSTGLASLLHWGKEKAPQRESLRSFFVHHRDGGIRTRDPLNPIQVRYRAALRPVLPSDGSHQPSDIFRAFPSNATGLRGACPERSEGSRNFVPLIAKPLTADPIFNLKSSIFNRPNPHLNNGPVS